MVFIIVLYMQMTFVSLELFTHLRERKFKLELSEGSLIGQGSIEA